MSVAVDKLPASDTEQFWRGVCEQAAHDHFAGYHVESDACRRLILTPVMPIHGMLQARLCALFPEHLPEGHTMVDVGVATEDGVKVPDAMWYTAARIDLRREEYASPLAGEICVEVLSPSNTAEEMAEKRALYFAQGAEEVWICDGEGKLTFWAEGVSKPIDRSMRCPAFPAQVSV